MPVVVVKVWVVGVVDVVDVRGVGDRAEKADRPRSALTSRAHPKRFGILARTDTGAALRTL